MRKSKRDYEVKVAKKSKDNPKVFYQLYLAEVKEKVGPPETSNGHTVYIPDNDKGLVLADIGSQKALCSALSKLMHIFIFLDNCGRT